MPGTGRERTARLDRAGGDLRRGRGRLLVQRVESELDCGLQLRVPAGRRVVRGDPHLYVRVDAVVLHAPAVLVEGERVPRHGDGRTVDQALVALDTDYAAPGPGADHRAEAEQLDRGRDDVPVGPGELVGHRDQRTAPRLLRVGFRPQPAAQAPADDPPGQLLHHKLGDVAAAVSAHVEDQPVAGHLGAQVTVEVRPALAHHVRDMQVAEPSVAELADQAAPPGHPVLVAQPPVRAQRHHHDPAHGAISPARGGQGGTGGRSSLVRGVWGIGPPRAGGSGGSSPRPAESARPACPPCRPAAARGRAAGRPAARPPRPARRRG